MIWFALFQGKLLNTRDASAEAIAKNEEISNLQKIVGLKAGDDSPDRLRYGSIVILSDSDAVRPILLLLLRRELCLRVCLPPQDGSHIRALIVNMIHSRWPKLATSGFLKVLGTPLIVSRKGAIQHEFMTTAEFDAFAATNNMAGYIHKYYKARYSAFVIDSFLLIAYCCFVQNTILTLAWIQGLGSWQSRDAKKIFKNTKPVSFIGDKDTDESLDMAFSRKRIADRKVCKKRSVCIFYYLFAYPYIPPAGAGYAHGGRAAEGGDISRCRADIALHRFGLRNICGVQRGAVHTVRVRRPSHMQPQDHMDRAGGRARLCKNGDKGGPDRSSYIGKDAVLAR